MNNRKICRCCSWSWSKRKEKTIWWNRISRKWMRFRPRTSRRWWSRCKVCSRCRWCI